MELPAYKVLPFPFYLKVLGISLFVALPVWLFRHHLIDLENEIAGLGVSILSFLILFSVVATLFKVITPDDWKKFKNWAMLKFLTSKDT